jgi:hypothetical protein
LLLRFIEAIEVTFSRHAPWIFLSVDRLGGQRSSQAQCHSRKGWKSCHSNSGQELLKRLGAFGLNKILVHVFSRMDTKRGSNSCWEDLPRERVIPAFSVFVSAVLKRFREK